MTTGEENIAQVKSEKARRHWDKARRLLNAKALKEYKENHSGIVTFRSFSPRMDTLLPLNRNMAWWSGSEVGLLFALHFIQCPISGAYDLLKKQALAKGMQQLKEEWEPEVVLRSPNPSSDRMKLVR